MIRSTIFSGIALCVLVATSGCNDSAATDQQKANSAQAEANDKIAAAKKDSDEKAAKAQAEADKKIADAQLNFTKTREDYRHKVTTDLADLDKKIADLDAKSKTATGKAKTDLDALLPAIHASRGSFATDWKTLDGATSTTWDATSARLNKEWTDLKALVDKA